MTGARRAMWPGLLEPAIGYALAVVQTVTAESLPNPTPCRGWDVQMLLWHASESLAALREGIDVGRIGLDPSPEDMSGDPVKLFRDRATDLLTAWATVATGPTERPADPARAPGGPTGGPSGPAIVAVADQCIALAVLADAGALELAVHGWDLSRACGRREPIPTALATGLLPVSALLVPRTSRYPLFGPPATVPLEASPSDHLVAYLGRNPR